MPQQIIHTDNLLTNLATAYKGTNPVANFIAPAFHVDRPSDKYSEYTKSTLRVYNNKVKGRERSKSINWDISESTYNCEEYELNYFIKNRKLRNTDKPINLRKDAMRQVKNAQQLAREKRVFDIAGSTSIVTQTSVPSIKWDITSGIPIADIRTALATINTSTLKEANSIVLTLQVALGILKTDEWKDTFKYTNSDKLFQVMAGLRNLGLEPMITNMAGLSSYEGTASDPAMEKFWGEKVLIFHREPNPTLETRTFMFSPFTAMDRIERERIGGERGEEIRIFEEIDELLIDASAAYLFTDTLT